jgi:hypothetical protein
LGNWRYAPLLNPDMPWNDEIRATWARQDRLAASPRTVALMMPLATELDVRAVLPTIRVPTLVLQHADDPIILPARGKKPRRPQTVVALCDGCGVCRPIASQRRHSARHPTRTRLPQIRPVDRPKPLASRYIRPIRPAPSRSGARGPSRRTPRFAHRGASASRRFTGR